MKKPIYLLTLIALLCATSCGGSVPGPNAPVSEKKAKCEAVSKDQSVGCGACAGLEFCGWTQTQSDDPTSGTCHYLADKRSPPAGMVGDPTGCPQPPQN
jgi:hypothetical protein